VLDHAADTTDERLRRILAVTDAALSQLDTEALFTELLERVRSMLDTDTAGILLVDREAQQLVAVAGIGLEDEVRQGFRLDIGRGFSGRVAATKAPVILDQVDATMVASPVLRRAGVTTLVGVPMVVGGEVVGVLHLGSLRPRTFTEQDVALLQLVADRAASASQTRQNQADRAATLALQRSLLPSRLPRPDGVDLAARYLPGHQLGVGGDWYDVFVLPAGDLGVVVGDVSGHGLRSAVVMGRLRSALRAYALVEDDPATVLTFLDRKITHFEAGNLATIVYAKINPARTEVTISLAGHPPPLLATPESAPELLRLPVDLPVGVGDATPRRSTTIALPTGSTLVCFTDGLVERRGESIDQGLARLLRVRPAASADETCTSIVEHMLVGTAEDDIAVLALRTMRVDPS
jgi:sigma-B regulation protein RsbU (phosphoserine phosphatase)